MTDSRVERRSKTHPPGDTRLPFEIDRDRLLYSTAFRRLAGVTQVVSPGEGEIFHNRLTHSLKVAQIARRLAEKLLRDYPEKVEAWGGISPEVTEAAALAHDLGYTPPFGHIAEEELNHLVAEQLCRAAGKDPKTEERDQFEGYEGNAQSFRIITELGVRRPKTKYGLDLTRAVLNATLKYPWKFHENDKKLHKYGAFRCDEEAFVFARESSPLISKDQPFVRSLEAQIMDWADDITYSVHDTEDFYRAGLIPLEGLATNPKERARFRASLRARYESRKKPLNMDGNFDKIFEGLFESLRIRDRFEGTRNQQEILYDFVSSKIGEFVRETKLFEPPGEDGEALDIPPELTMEVFFLKELTWTYVIENPSLAAHQQGQRKAIQTLFHNYSEAFEEKRWTLFPAFFREPVEELVNEGTPVSTEDRTRLIADTIASMTDRQAMIIYHQFTGISQSSMLDPVIS